MVSLWEVVVSIIALQVTTAIIKGAKWYWLYKLITRKMGDFKMPKIDLGRFMNNEKAD